MRSLGLTRNAAKDVIDGLRDAGVIVLHHREPAAGSWRYGVSVFVPG
jgi:hypothetical protein